MRRRAGLAAVMLAMAAAPGLAQTSPRGQAAASPTEIIPLDLSGPRPLAMLAVGAAEPVPVVFDTGASGNVLDAALARELALPELGPARVGSPAGGAPIEGFRTRIAEGRLGGAVLRDVAVVAFPLPLPRARGVFGPNSFSGRLVRIDFGRGEIVVMPKGPATLPAGPSYPYSEGPRPLPGMTVEVAGTPHPAHIDTGSNGALTFPAGMADRLPLETPPVPVGRARVGGGEEREVLGARLRGTVTVGPVTLENPEVRFLEGLPRVNVGMGVLRGLTLVLDPAERRSWLLPAAAAGRAR